MKENESREREYVVKSYIQNSLNVDIKESENNRTNLHDKSRNKKERQDVLTNYC